MYFNFPESNFKEIANGLGEEDCRQFEGKLILLAGSNGLLGTAFKVFLLYLNKYILKTPCRIIGADCFVGTPPFLFEAENLTNINHDLSTPLGLSLGTKEKFDFIINCSGRAAPQNYASDPISTMEVGSRGVRHLLELAYFHDAKIVCFSSSEVLPNPGVFPTPEESIPQCHTSNKRSAYDGSKIFLEIWAYIFKSYFATKVKVVRPFNVVSFFASNDQRVLPNFIGNVLKNQPMQVYAPSTQSRSFVWFSDFCCGVLKVLLHGNDLIYHIGRDSEEVTILELAKRIETITGKTGLIKIVETPDVYRHEPQRRLPSIEKARRELGYEPKVGLDEMIRRFYTWAKDNY